LLVLLALFDKFLITRDQQFTDELMADSFAISYLDGTEIAHLSAIFNKYAAMFFDNELDNKQNELREKELKKNIGLAKSKELGYVPGSIFYKIPKRRLFYLFLINAMVVVPAFYSKPPGYGLVLWLLIAAFGLYRIHKYYDKLINVLNLAIARKLESWR